MLELKKPSVGVGQTALFIAWMRQPESESPDPPFRDPLAGAVVWALAEDPVLADVAEVIKQTHTSAAGFPAYFAVRTRFFDDEILAGVDGRTVRFDLPAGTRWFEVELPERRGVAADLRGDRQQALRAAGFDPGQPTVWLVEGRLMDLTDAANESLPAGLTELSAPGSRLTPQHLQAAMPQEEGEPVRERVEEQGAQWLSARDDLAEWLGGHGWRAEVYAGDDPCIGHGRTMAALPACWLTTAVLTDAR